MNARWERTRSELSACDRITPDGFLNPGRNRNIETFYSLEANSPPNRGLNKPPQNRADIRLLT